jgi:hypothetical protein
VYSGWIYLSIVLKKRLPPREQVYLDTLNPTYNILKFAGSSLGFKHYYSTIVQMKERNNNNHPFLGRKHSKESKLKMSLSSHLSLPFKILDIETGNEKLFNSNVQAANFLKISELTIRKYKKSGAVFKNR